MGALGPGPEGAPTAEEMGLVALALPAGTRGAEILDTLMAPLEATLAEQGMVLGLTAPARATETGAETRITLPGLTLAGRGAGQARAGDVAFLLRQRDDGQLDFEIDLPRRIEAVDNGTVLGVVQLATASRVTGTWSARLQTFTAIDAGIADFGITATVNGRQRSVGRLGELRVTRAPAPDGQGRWSGTYGITLRGLDLTPDDETHVAIEQLRLGGTMADADVQKLAELNAAYGIDPMFGGAEELELVDLADCLEIGRAHV